MNQKGEGEQGNSFIRGPRKTHKGLQLKVQKNKTNYGMAEKSQQSTKHLKLKQILLKPFQKTGKRDCVKIYSMRLALLRQ